MSEHHSALVQWAEDHLEAQVPEAGPEAPKYSVSVIIPSHRRVPIGLNAFRNQDCVSEVIVLANGSLKLPGEHVRQVRWQGHGKGGAQRTRARTQRRRDGAYIGAP